MNDHGEAHTEHKLGQNLSPEMIRKLKSAWETEVKLADGRAVIGISQVEGANWDYINHTRLFRFADQLGLDLHTMRSYDRLRALNMISADGIICDSEKWLVDSHPKRHLYDLGENRYLYSYTSDILERVIEDLGLVDISAPASREELRIMAKDGILVFVQGPFYFRNASTTKGIVQLREGYTKVAGVKVQFTFYPWECTSDSSRWDRLTGRKVASVVGLVSGSEFRKDGGVIQLSCLAAGTYFQQIHWRPKPQINSLASDEEFASEAIGAFEDNKKNKLM